MKIPRFVTLLSTTSLLVVGIGASLISDKEASLHLETKLHAAQKFPPLAVPVNADSQRYCGSDDLLKRRACLIKEAAEGATRNLRQNQKKLGMPITPETRARSYFAIMELVGFVQQELSSARYLMRKYNKGFFPPSDVRDAIENSYGICGNHVAAFLALAKEIGLESRAVQFWYSDADGNRLSHIATETLVDGRWIFVDVTWGGLFLKDDRSIFSAMTLDDVLRKPVRARVNVNNVWMTVLSEVRIDPFAYLSAHDLQITRDYEGEITLYWQPQGGVWSTNLAHIPNYAGDNKADNRQSGIVLKTALAKGEFQFELDVAGVGGCQTSKLEIGSRTIKIASKGNYSVRVRDPDAIRISGDDDVCYIVFSRISAMAVGRKIQAQQTMTRQLGH